MLGIDYDKNRIVDARKVTVFLDSTVVLMEDIIGFDSYQRLGVAGPFSNHQPLFSLATPINITVNNLM
jgi:hypothetical protein